MTELVILTISSKQAGDKIPTLISTLLAHTKNSQTPLRFIQLIGTAVSVLVRLKACKEEPVERLSAELKVRLVHSILNVPSS